MTNISSAFVMMAAGDVMAQELEHNNVDRLTGKDEIPPEKRLSLKRYGTVHPDAAQTAAKLAYDAKTKHKKAECTKKNENENDTDQFEEAKEMISYAVSTVKAQWEWMDKIRVFTMVAWSGLAYTPLYVAIFRICDKYMPHQTPTTVGARVLLSFALSVPINTAFFAYGTLVHHSMEWMAIQREWRFELEDLGISNDTVDKHAAIHGSVVPYDVKMLQATVILKLESELVTTVLDSAKVWIPVNLLNFTIVAPHLRPLVLLTFSVFWNAYLSLAQHRDLSLPDTMKKI